MEQHTGSNETSAAQRLVERDKLERFREGRLAGKLEGFREGELKGKRDALLRLAARAEIALTDEDRRRVHACADTATLDRWLDNLLGAATASDVLDRAPYLTE
jgi:hypothetical protein